MKRLDEVYIYLYHTFEIMIGNRWRYQGTKLMFLVNGTPQTNFMIKEMARVEFQRFKRFKLYHTLWITL